MRRLWAPWRMQYIEEAVKQAQGCIFCEKPRQNKDEENYILLRGKHCYIMLNAFPYNNGHLMIAPYRHITQIEELTDEEAKELFQQLKLSLQALKKAMNPDGFNIGVNIGRPAGAGFDHLHVHVVPRWNGDTNFMPILAETKVISEHLANTYKKLKQHLP
ncbi:MAG TPA: HIT domain-containing protein [Candidatus Methanomethylia archaeon]|nr:HIT domain-containing protein [Candidatus Methanomethylicia archaeon]